MYRYIIYTYVYIYIHISLHTHIYIYICMQLANTKADRTALQLRHSRCQLAHKPTSGSRSGCYSIGNCVGCRIYFSGLVFAVCASKMEHLIFFAGTCVWLQDLRRIGAFVISAPVMPLHSPMQGSYCRGCSLRKCDARTTKRRRRRHCHEVIVTIAEHASAGVASTGCYCITHNKE